MTSDEEATSRASECHSSERASPVPSSNEEESNNHGYASEEQKEFVVEKVLAKRTINGRTQYLIKWLDYDAPTDNTCVRRLFYL